MARKGDTDRPARRRATELPFTARRGEVSVECPKLRAVIFLTVEGTILDLQGEARRNGNKGRNRRLIAGPSPGFEFWLPSASLVAGMRETELLDPIDELAYEDFEFRDLGQRHHSAVQNVTATVTRKTTKIASGIDPDTSTPANWGTISCMICSYFTFEGSCRSER
jgi:hypothetical protein